MHFPFAEYIGVWDLPVDHVDRELLWNIGVGRDIRQNKFDVLLQVSHEDDPCQCTEPLVALDVVLDINTITSWDIRNLNSSQLYVVFISLGQMLHEPFWQLD